ncbi:hypothetical protein WG909_10620 [Peptostreptococcaceae bacterium AGR-M142]
MSFIRVDKILKNMNLISKNPNKDIMDYDKKYKEFEDRISDFDKHEKLVKDLISFVKKNKKDMDDITRSKFLAFLGNMVINLSPYVVEDCGYSYLKEALKLDVNNYYAMLGICCIYDNFYTCDIVDELEYLDYIRIMIKNFDDLSEFNREIFLAKISEVIRRRKNYLLHRKNKK